jgi:hypothetical protein
VIDSKEYDDLPIIVKAYVLKAVIDELTDIEDRFDDLSIDNEIRANNKGRIIYLNKKLERAENWED